MVNCWWKKWNVNFEIWSKLNVHFCLANLANQLAAFEVIVPRRVSSQGVTLSDDVTHHYSVSTVQDKSRRRRRRRHLNSNDLDLNDDHDHIHYRFDVGGQEKHFHLRPNAALLAPSFVVERKSAKHFAHNFARFANDRQCHYVGKVRGHPQSTVAFSTCYGLVSLSEPNQTEPNRTKPNQTIILLKIFVINHNNWVCNFTWFSCHFKLFQIILM